MNNSILPLVAWMAGGIRFPNRRAPADPLNGVDIDAEYELIKQKRSKLSRALRERVVYIKERTHND